jgi:hypothetical protein
MMAMLPHLMFAVWIGGVLGGAAIGMASEQNVGWTRFKAIAFLAIWPAVLALCLLVVFFAEPMKKPEIQ